VLFQLGELECWAGNWQTAARLAEEGHEVASRTGQAVAERLALTLEATVEALGFLELSLGNAEEAVAYLERGLGLEVAAGEDPAVLRIVPEAIEALLAVGRLQDARPLVDGLQRRGSQQDRAWARAGGARCRGLLEAASGDLALSQSTLQNAVREHEQLRQPFELARTLLALGIVQRRSKKKRPARASLGLALGSFEELGARLWADRTRVELGRIGGRASSPLDLTPTEQQVAERVAYGQTNQEVAAALFMSVKTVEANLTRTYRKLGLSSRHELARWMRANPGRHSR
jgi:DNA-binding CsgD family transcriptional regulator